METFWLSQLRRRRGVLLLLASSGSRPGMLLKHLTARRTASHQKELRGSKCRCCAEVQRPWSRICSIRLLLIDFPCLPQFPQELGEEQNKLK